MAQNIFAFSLGLVGNAELAKLQPCFHQSATATFALRRVDQQSGSTIFWPDRGARSLCFLSGGPAENLRGERPGVPAGETRIQLRCGASARGLAPAGARALARPSH